MMEWDSEEIERLRRGIDHFRAGEYFAAHDDWEDVWQGLRGRQRTFWQAMIQLVVGAYHLNNGNRTGCQSLWSKALVKCDDLAQTYEADVPDPLPLLTGLLHACLASLRQNEEPWPDITHFANAVLSEAWFAFR
jgi:predicted metal-dependent hydrolase